MKQKMTKVQIQTQKTQTFGRMGRGPINISVPLHRRISYSLELALPF